MSLLAGCQRSGSQLFPWFLMAILMGFPMSHLVEVSEDVFEFQLGSDRNLRLSF